MKRTFSNIYLFLKKNLIYVILTCCVLAVGLSVSLVLLTTDNSVKTPVGSIEKPDQTPDQTPVNPGDGDLNDKPANDGNSPDTPVGPTEPIPTVITFIMPIENSTSISEYSQELTYNSTLGRFEIHDAVDFFAPENTEVLAVYGGTVEAVEKSTLTGYTVVLDHGDGLKTYYNSLAEDIDLQVGEKVNQGDVVGVIALTNRQEYKEGAHLHFEVFENGVNIDPVKYLEYQK